MHLLDPKRLTKWVRTQLKHLLERIKVKISAQGLNSGYLQHYSLNLSVLQWLKALQVSGSSVMSLLIESRCFSASSKSSHLHARLEAWSFVSLDRSKRPKEPWAQNVQSLERHKQGQSAAWNICIAVPAELLPAAHLCVSGGRIPIHTLRGDAG